MVSKGKPRGETPKLVATTRDVGSKFAAGYGLFERRTWEATVMNKCQAKPLAPKRFFDVMNSSAIWSAF